MLLVPPIPALRLADIFASCLQAVQGVDNPLGLSPVKHAAVLLVDGLGAANLRDRAGHARWLMKSWQGRNLSADVGFPSTTASALTTLTTGVQAGEHGIVGYALREPLGGGIIKHLKDWEPQVDPRDWQKSPTLFERALVDGIPSLSQGEPRFAKSDFTQAVWRGATFMGAQSLSEQFANARSFAEENDTGLAYLYWPALDRTGHGSGWESDSWLHRLEELDAILADCVGLLGPETGLIITADHGMVDVPHEDKIIVDEPSSLLKGVAVWAGEPRVPQLYLEPGVKASAVAAVWQAEVGDRAQVVTKAELLDSGVLGPLAEGVSERIGDVLIVCEGSLAVYHAPTAGKASQAMVGQHGSITPREREVPVIPWGAWA